MSSESHERAAEEQADLNLQAWIGEQLATIPPAGWAGLQVLSLQLANAEAWVAVDGKAEDRERHCSAAQVYRGLVSLLQTALEQGRAAREMGGVGSNAPVGQWPWAWGSAGVQPRAKTDEPEAGADETEREALRAQLLQTLSLDSGGELIGGRKPVRHSRRRG